MSTKKKIITIIIGIEVVIIAAVIGFLFYINSDAVKVDRQLELAQRYLLEEYYEQAIAAFGVVIDIDPRNEDAYLGMAEAYAAADDLENAVKVLEKASRIYIHMNTRGLSDSMKDYYRLLMASKNEKSVKQKSGMMLYCFIWKDIAEKRFSESSIFLYELSAIISPVYNFFKKDTNAHSLMYN